MTLCIIITIVYLAIMGALIACMFTYSAPADFKTATGTVTNFKYKSDEDVIDHIINNSTYFNVTLDNNSTFAATGVYFDKIDKELFNVITRGGEITVTYEDGGFFGSNRVFGIVYNGKTYLNPDDVIASLKKENNTSHIVCPIFMGVVTLIAGGLIFLAYKKVNAKKARGLL